MDEPIRNEPLLPGEQAAVQMPPEAGEPAEPQQEPMQDGTPAAPDTAPPSTLHPDLYTETAPFFQIPLPPRTYMDVPYYPNLHSAETEQVVLRFRDFLHYAGYEAEAINLEQQYRTLVKASGYSYERLRHELEPVRQQLEQQIRESEKQLEAKRIEFIEQMGRARLPLPETAHQRRRPAPKTEPIAISPQLVEQALTHDFATADEICGQHGVTPAGVRETWWTHVGQWLMELFAPLVAGLLLGVNIAVITGFLNLEAFRKGQQMWLVALAMVIGFFAEKLVGAVWYHLSSSLAQASERPLNEEGARPFPRLRTAFSLLGFGLLALLLGAAVMTVDALGLRMLHEQAIQQAQLLGTKAGELLPFWVYLIAAGVISLPYLIYKAVIGWRQGELRLRESRIAYLRWKHIEERRSEPEVQAAFRLAEEVVGLEQRLNSLREKLKAVQERLDSAYTHAVGCQQEFKRYWDELLKRLEREPGRGREIPFNRRLWGDGQPPETLLRRLIRSFRRG